MKGFFILGLCVSPAVFFAQMKQDTIQEKNIEAVSLIKRLPVTKQIIDVEKDLGNKNLGQDLPVLLKSQTSIVTSTDAGNGVGYTALRVRGIDGTRINVMMNGVPYNDSESQSTYFVDVPDLASSASQIVIQRGVGTSSNGVSAFGASINVLTQDPSKDSYFSTQQSYGSFNTHKHSFEAGTGDLLAGKLSFMGRYSIIKSDGYIDRAFSDLNSYNVTGLYKNKGTSLRFMAFGGKEKTYQAWNGIDKAQMESNRRYNSAGAIYNEDWSKIVGFYDNETDNYTQNHYHLLWEQRLNDNMKLSTTLHYTKGKGYYENFKQGESFSKYNLPNVTIGGETIEYFDFIRRKWLNNNFYGVVSELNWKLQDVAMDFGFVANQYYGRHYGEILNPSYDKDVTKVSEYYRDNGIKDEISGYAKALWKLNNFELFGDLQLRSLNYRNHSIHATPSEYVVFDNDYLFFNPKAGINYNIPQGKVYFSYAQANREPKRSDIVDSNNMVKEEKLHDFELGFQKQSSVLNFETNIFYMLYDNQLVLNGKLNDVGDALHENVKDSYRFGLEISAVAKISSEFNVGANATLSSNKVKNYNYFNTFTGETKNLGDRKIAFSPSFIGNVSLNYLPIEGMQLSLLNKYVGEQYMDNTESSDRKLDAYFTSDFVAGYNFPYKRMDVGFSLMVNNIFNKKYASNGYVYNDPSWVSTETPYFFPQAGTNFMLGMSLKFK